MLQLTQHEILGCTMAFVTFIKVILQSCWIFIRRDQVTQFTDPHLLQYSVMPITLVLQFTIKSFTCQLIGMVQPFNFSGLRPMFREEAESNHPYLPPQIRLELLSLMCLFRCIILNVSVTCAQGSQLRTERVTLREGRGVWQISRYKTCQLLWTSYERSALSCPGQ